MSIYSLTGKRKTKYNKIGRVADSYVSYLKLCHVLFSVLGLMISLDSICIKYLKFVIIIAIATHLPVDG